jgi:osmoprotectant transport system ATP-binding protein
MTDAPAIVFNRVSKHYGGASVLDNFSLEVIHGEIITIIGRSGCGKTTALKLVNGLITPDSGEVYVRGQRVADCNGIALRRNIGYVIQNIGLFPHLTIGKNIAYVPSLSKKWNRETEKAEIARLLTTVGLNASFAMRYPSELSGGERQRVGIARAIATQPDILLMDEPFSAVDEITRRALQDELLRLKARLKLTVLFVTHDIEEALKLGTRILVMANGCAVQIGTAEEIRNKPADDFVKTLTEAHSGRCAVTVR